MDEFEQDQQIGQAQFVAEATVVRVERLESALNKLAEQVANLANKLEEHMTEPDAHNPGVVRKK
jgi:uncharacterized protein (UPF0335 family)